jgi:hypothetical protein
LDDALVVGGLDAAEEGCVEICGVGGVAVSAGLNTGVDALEGFLVLIWWWEGIWYVRLTVALQCQRSM